MDSEKHNRQTTFLCPTCGCTQFWYEEGVDETIEIVKCASCGRELTKDELIQENGENLSEHAKEMGGEILEDFAEEMKKSLKESLKCSKYIRIK